MPRLRITLSSLPKIQPCPCLCCSVIQPQALGDLHLAAVVVLAFLGAWFGTVLGGAYVGETYTFYLSSGLAIPNPMYWKASEGWGGHSMGTAWARRVGCSGIQMGSAVTLHGWRHRLRCCWPLKQPGPSKPTFP